MDGDRLHRLSSDPDATGAALAAWAAQRPDLALHSPEQLRALQESALAVREFDGGRAMRVLASREPASVAYPRWGLRRSWRFAREQYEAMIAQTPPILKLILTRVVRKLRKTTEVTFGR